MNLSKNLTLKETTKSDIALRYGIKNEPNTKQLENLKVLATEVFQKIRDHFGVPIKVTSGFRSEALNKKIGGSKSSDHMKGCAIDIDMDGTPDITNAQVFNFIKDNLTFRQLIWEFGNDDNPDWVHVSYVKGDNKKQILKAIKKGNKTIYVSYNG
jgi:zinc D-Ala-D-Ala carboxypeptidase